jgi:hypothetical protein
LDIKKQGGETGLKKHNIRLIVDIAMTVLLPMLMAYSLIGEMLHEIIGTAIFVLFIVHHILNRKWYGALFRGNYNARRIFQTVLDMLLLVFMLLQPISGILMSKHLYTLLPTLPISAQARSTHMLLAYWGYTLMCIHAGTHLAAQMKKLFMKSKKIIAAVCVAVACISVYGCAAFIKRGFPGYMSGKTMFAFFDYSEPRVFFFLDYLAIMVLFMMTGCLIIYGLSKVNTKKRLLNQ